MFTGSQHVLMFIFDNIRYDSNWNELPKDDWNSDDGPRELKCPNASTNRSQDNERWISKSYDHAYFQNISTMIHELTKNTDI
jgi:hypothetical protein